MENQAINRDSEISILWAKVSFYATIIFMALLALLHILKPELDISWSMISEYAIGRFGWLMTLAFIAWAIGFIGLFFSIRSYVHSKVGKVGLILLLVSSFGLLLAGFFTTDPVTATAEQHTTSGMLHSIGGTLGMAMPFSALLLYLSIAKNQYWASGKKTLKWATSISLIGFLVAFVAMGVFLSKANGVFSEDTPVGYPNRLEVLGYCIWLITFSRLSINLQVKSK